MHFTESGSGTPLVLLPAFPFDSRIWDRARLGLAEHARVITPDPPGFGRTPQSPEDPDLTVTAREVVALLDKLGLDRAVIGGCSMGGYTTLAVLRAAPSRVSGLVLIDTKHTADAPEARENRLAMATRADHEGVTGWLADTMLPVLLGKTSTAQRPDVVDTARHLLSVASPEAVAWAQRAMAARPDSSAALRAADVPALVVHGAEDAIIPVDAGRAMMELLPQAEMVVLDESGHLPPLESPAALTTAVTTWLSAM
jgi:pimeloyl-ACP methyl ester carboxylesterase